MDTPFRSMPRQKPGTTTDEIFERAERLCLLATQDASFIAEFRVAMKQATNLEHAGWKRRTGMTQEAKVLKHLRTIGSITVREAMNDYSIQSLTKRISNLRAEGHDIVSSRRRHKVTGQEYVRYSLAA